MRLDLILKDIQDPQARENFDRLVKFVGKQQILDGEWNFYEIDIPNAKEGLSFKHNLSFVPKDVIILNSVGDQNFRLRYNEFTKDNLYLDAAGPVTLRLLVGRYPSYSSNTKSYPYVPFSGASSTSSGGIDFCDIGVFMASVWDALLADGLEIYTDQNGFSLITFGSMFPEECNIEFLSSLVDQNQQYLFSQDGFVLR